VDIVGSVALVLALLASGYGFVAGIVGIAGRRPLLMRAARYSGVVVFTAVSVAVTSVLYLLLTNDFSTAYVAEHSSLGLPIVYKLAALWAGQEGSLLFWTWLLSLFALIALIQNGKKYEELMAVAGVILAGIELFFLLLNNFVSGPFRVLGVTTAEGGTHLVRLADGQGLNPLLQYAEMVLHPPLLYMGYTGFAVPFALALAAMFRREPGDAWLHITRRWIVVAWTFLGVGILLGAHWAYAVLGWGGYWAWDPVENASLFPWLTGTALLHSMVAQEHRGIMRRWSLWLLFATFWLSVFGTFLTRSGVVNSVHAFEKSPIGTWLITFLAAVLCVCLWASWRNRLSLRPRRHFDSLLSREATLFFGVLVLLLACLGVFWGTLLPVFSAWVRGSSVTVGPPFFNLITVPIAMAVLLLIGATPFIAWGRNSFARSIRTLGPSLVSGVAAGAIAYWFGFRYFGSLLCVSLGTFAAVTILLKFIQGARALAARSQTNPLFELRTLIMGRTRQYGAYIAHLGMVLILFGISGQPFNRDIQKTMRIGDEVTIGPYTLVSQVFDQTQTANYQGVRATIEVLENGRSTMMLYPERRFYPTSQVAETQVAIYSSLERDLYVVYEGDSPKDGGPLIHVHLNPLVRWIWLGGLVTVLGIILSLVPSETSASRARPERETSAEIFELALTSHAR
jgi:cytochrome c-type biogenesis protein CcmF